ncbi:hypothetical protein ACOSP7_030413 [Xanthoceras sorbifolium]
MPCLQQIKIIFFFFDSQSSSRQLGFVYDRVAKYCSQVFKTSILTQNTVFFCGPAANKFLFSNEDKHVNIWYPSSVKKILLPSATQRSSTEESKQTRKLLPNFLKPEAHQRHGFYCTGAFRVQMGRETTSDCSSTCEELHVTGCLPGAFKRRRSATCCQVC